MWQELEIRVIVLSLSYSPKLFYNHAQSYIQQLCAGPWRIYQWTRPVLFSWNSQTLHSNWMCAEFWNSVWQEPHQRGLSLGSISWWTVPAEVTAHTNSVRWQRAWQGQERRRSESLEHKVHGAKWLVMSLLRKEWPIIEVVQAQSGFWGSHWGFKQGQWFTF